MPALKSSWAKAARMSSVFFTDVAVEPVESTRSPTSTTNLTPSAMNCLLSARTMSTEHVPGLRPSSAPIHWVSAMTPNFHCWLNADVTAKIKMTDITMICNNLHDFTTASLGVLVTYLELLWPKRGKGTTSQSDRSEFQCGYG